MVKLAQMILRSTELSIAYSGGNIKCTGLKAVSYPDTRKQINGSTVKFGTNTRIFYIAC